MSENELHVETIDIQRAPEFLTDGFRVDGFSDGVNIVHGPNGSGKTALARSIQAALWPQTAAEESSLVGRFSVDDDEWRVDLVSQNATYQRNGAESNGPSLPSSDQRDRYHLSLHDLLQDKVRNESFARRIQQESIGGYDLAQAHESLSFHGTPSSKQIKEFQQAKAARKTLRDAKSAIRDLEDQKAKLPRLESKLEAAKEAQSRVELLEQAIEFVEARDDLKRAQEELAGFADLLSNVDGNEAELAADYTDRIDDCQNDLEKAERRAANATETIEEANLPDEGVSDGAIEALQGRQATLKSIEDRKRTHEEELANARERLDNARGDIPLDADDETLSSIEPPAWREIEGFIETAEAVQSDRKARNAIDNWLGGQQSEGVDRATLQRGQQALEAWLSEPRAKTTKGEPATRRVATVSAGIIAAAGVALGTLVHPALFLTLLAAAGVLWYGYQASPPANESTGARATHRESYERTSLESVESWTTDDVRSRLTEIHDELADSHLEEQRAERREALLSGLDDVEQREADLEEQRSKLSDTYGVAPATTDLELAALAKAVFRWQDAYDDVQANAAEVEKLEDQLATERAAIEDDMAPYGYESVADAAEAAGYVHDLKDRKQAYEAALDDHEQAEEAIESSQEELKTLQSKRAQLYADIGLEDGAVAELEDLCRQVDDYEEAVQQVQQQQVRTEREANKLRNRGGYDAELEDRTVAELEDEQQAAEQEAAEAEELQKEITEINTKIDQAKRNSELEEAIAERDRALDALEAKLGEDTAAMVGDVLVNYLTETTEETSRPEVFTQAREILAQITRGRYRLDLDEGTFRAYDTVKERGFALDELSSGTRVQVLLAVRIAFVEQQEQGAKLPLILDETLANSDDRRAEIIIESAIELARAGRQVFYFTAQGDEVAKWEQALAETEGLDYTSIDLTRVRGSGRGLDIPEIGGLIFERPSLPDPDAHDHASYGDALGVPAFSPREGTGSAHLWYVVDDPTLLHDFLELGIETWGQLRTLFDQTDLSFVTADEETLRVVRANGVALEEFVKAWQVGRGKQVDRAALEETTAVTDSFIERVSALAEDVNGDAEAIMAALRAGKVDRFRSSKMDALQRYFEENGFIQQRDTLPVEMLRARVVSRLASSGLDRGQAVDHAQNLFSRLNGFSPDTSAAASSD